MSRVLEQFEFGTTGASKGRYPWAEWTDGKIRELKHGEDFQCKPSTMATMVRGYAKKNGLTARVCARRGENKVVIQFPVAGAPEATPPKERKTKKS